MMSKHFRLRSELTGAIAKRLRHATNQLSTPGSFFNQLFTDIYIYTHTCININRVLIVRISALRLLALRGWRTLCVCRRRPLGAWGHID